MSNAWITRCEVRRREGGESLRIKGFQRIEISHHLNAEYAITLLNGALRTGTPKVMLSSIKDSIFFCVFKHLEEAADVDEQVCEAHRDASRQIRASSRVNEWYSAPAS